ncbi:substrate-binding domain-containing protein [Companilactobacillus bobalius]|uniref:GntR family transcriptional regulator n=1 Tax=Companilactobacillus bobalius TaxID=2801451 RepID=UPI001302CEDE|nr:substrate-binding domain-containing protein [Companilactobacillus bobalius]
MIYQTLKNDILTQKITIGSKLPSENQLAQDYKVSRITSKRALTELENDGLVTRKAGIGTIVKKNNIEKITKSEIIFVIPFANNNEFGDYTSGLLQILDDTSDFQLTTINNNIFRNLPLSRIKAAKGIIYYVESLSLELPIITNLYLNDIPIVLLDKSFEDLPIPSVTSDNFTGGYLATNELIKNGHHNITFLTNEVNLNEASVRSRYFGYLSALKKQQITPEILHADLDQDKTIEYLVNNINNKKITGLVAENDVIAIRIMNELRNHNIQIPQQLSIIGFDNIQASKLSYPALSTIDQNFVALGENAANLLLNLINNSDKSITKRTTIPVKLIERQSINTLGDK